MELILLENIQNLGQLGDRVSVRPGYGRNYLVPQGKAVPATKDNIEVFEQRRAELEARAAERKAAAEARRDAVDGQTITIEANASNEGKLYGSVGTRELSDALTEAGFAIDKSEIDLPEGAFRTVGEFEVELHLYAEVTATIRLVIRSDDVDEEALAAATTLAAVTAENDAAADESAEEPAED